MTTLIAPIYTATVVNSTDTFLLNHRKRGVVYHKKADWVSWAKEKADWYDPIVKSLIKYSEKEIMAPILFQRKKEAVIGINSFILARQPVGGHCIS